MNEEITAVCIKCDGQFTEEQIKGKSACPSCGTTSLPLDPKRQINININVHELRILCVWAENYACSVKENADDLKDTVNKIAIKIENQLPSELWQPLTFSRELIDLKENLGHNQKIELHRNGKIEEI